MSDHCHTVKRWNAIMRFQRVPRWRLCQGLPYPPPLLHRRNGWTTLTLWALSEPICDWLHSVKIYETATDCSAQDECNKCCKGQCMLISCFITWKNTEGRRRRTQVARGGKNPSMRQKTVQDRQVTTNAFHYKYDLMHASFIHNVSLRNFVAQKRVQNTSSMKPKTLKMQVKISRCTQHIAATGHLSRRPLWLAQNLQNTFRIFDSLEPVSKHISECHRGLPINVKDSGLYQLLHHGSASGQGLVTARIEL